MASASIEYGGWDHKNQTLTPIRLAELLARPQNLGPSWLRDSLAAAAEAGRLNAGKYIEQIFTGKEDVHAFCHVLREAGGDPWLTDRHHHAVRKLGNAEFDVTTYVGITALFDPAE